MQITKSTLNSLVPVGAVLTYTLTVTNNGPAVATNVIVTDILPLSTSMVEGSPECAQHADVVTCELTELAVGESDEFAISIAVPLPTLLNRVSVESGSLDPNAANDPDEVATGGIPPSSVPAVRSLELILIAGLLFVGIAYYLRRRRLLKSGADA